MSELSKAARAVHISGRLILPSFLSGKAFSKSLRYSGIAFILASSFSGVLPISLGEKSGPFICSSILPARASQKNECRKATFHSEGDERGSLCPYMPTACALPSLKPISGLWQLEHDRELSAD